MRRVRIPRARSGPSAETLLKVFGYGSASLALFVLLTNFPLEFGLLLVLTLEVRRNANRSQERDFRLRYAYAIGALVRRLRALARFLLPKRFVETVARRLPKISRRNTLTPQKGAPNSNEMRQNQNGALPAMAFVGCCVASLPEEPEAIQNAYALDGNASINELILILEGGISSTNARGIKPSPNSRGRKERIPKG